MTTNAIKTRTKTTVDLEPGDCRWPIGDPRQPDFHHCGARQVLGRPYCNEHLSLACEPGKSRQQATRAPMPLRRAA